ncbi:hypothetical protein Goarm_006038, partial [Gossypium armourianum]|nr:hypothetical protein [Gossypium armourianum]
MEGIRGDGASSASPLSQWGHDAWRMYQYYLDKTTPHTAYRWIGTLVITAIYCLRVYYVQGFYIVAYGLGIYLLNLLIGFLSPLVDPELEVTDRPLLPTKGSDEFKPFIRRLPEFKFCRLLREKFSKCRHLTADRIPNNQRHCPSGRVLSPMLCRKPAC